MIRSSLRNIIARISQILSISLFLLLLTALSAPMAMAATPVKYIRSTGGDCASIGVWNAAAKTCTLSADLIFGATNGIIIDGEGITVDGAGHTITGGGGNFSGVTWSMKANNILRNLTVRQFRYGAYVLSSSNAVVTGNTFIGNNIGAFLQGATNGQVYNNNFDSNTTQAKVSGGSGNVFSLPAPIGGNWWNGYDSPVEGCNDFNKDNFCDAAYAISGGSDALPWNWPSGWSSPPPPDTDAPAISAITPTGVVATGSASFTVSYTDRSNIDAASATVTLDGTPLPGCVASETQINCGIVSGYSTGPHAIGGSVADIHGNTAAISGAFSYVDDQPPAITALLPTGFVNSPSQTISAALADSGTGVNPATVRVNLDGADLTGCSVSASSVSCPVTGLADGAHTFTVSAADMEGNTASVASSFSVDTTAPIVTSVTPSGTVYTGTTTVQVNFNDGGSGINVSSEAVYLDGVSISGCLPSAISISCTVKNLTLGDHTLSGTVSDLAGNTSPIAGSFTFIDNTPPVIRDLSPPIFINKSYANVGATLGDAGVGVDTASVAVYLDGAALSGCTVTASNASCIVYGISLGDHTFSVTAGDKAGNVATANGSFTYDPLAPTVSKAIYLSNNPTGGGCSQVGTWFPSTKTCVLTEDLMFIKTNGFIFNADGITLDGGGHYIVSTGGYTSGISAMLRKDITIKSLKIRQFRNGAYILSSNNVTLFNDTFSNNTYGAYLSNATNSKVHRNNFVDNTYQAFVSGGSGNIFDEPSPDGGNYWSNFDTPAEGCSDAGADGFCDAAYAAYGATDNLPWTVQSGWPAPPGYDGTAPQITNIQPSGVISTGAATVSAYLSDDISGVNTATVSVYLDGAALSGCSITASSASCGVYGLADGTHNIIVRASDLMGNTGSASGSFGVDLAPPGIRDIQPAGFINSSSASASAYVYDLVSGVDSASISVYVQYGTVGSCTYDTNTKIVNCPVSGLGEGRHDMTVSAQDNVGHSASADSYFSVDTAGPVITSLQPTGTVNKTSATIIAYMNDAGSGVNAAGVAVYLDGSAVTGCTVTSASAVCNVYNLAETSHSYTVQIPDRAGNVTSQTNTFTVDTRVTTKYIRNNTTGGDCTIIGTWNNATKTCTLVSDYTFSSGGIIINDSDITLDGGGHLITGSGGYTSGISVQLKSNVTIRNIALRQFRYAVNLTSANNTVVWGNRFLSNTYGVYLSGASSTQVYNNNFDSNTIQAYVSGGSGNLFNLTLPTGGNWWSNFDTPAEGCSDANADGFCDAAYSFTGGSDALPHVLEYPFPSG